MICSNCKKNINVPLYLYNGETTCPICKNKFVEVSNLSVTKENDEYYSLSKIALMRYLSPKSITNDTKSKNKKSGNLFEKCLSLCKKSAKLGNPKAVYQLAYLYQNYIIENKNLEERMKLAIDYYGILAYSQLSYIKIENNIANFTNEEFVKLKINSAKNILMLANKYSYIIKNSIKYGFEENKNRLLHTYGEDIFDGFTYSNDMMDNVDGIYNIMLSTKNKVRAPLFGSIILSGKELKSLFGKDDDKKSKLTILKLIQKDRDFLKYRYVDKYGHYKEDKYYNRFAKNSVYSSLIEEVKDNDYINLYFFNTSGKHVYLNNKQIENIRNQLNKDEYELISKIVEVSTGEIAIFYEDDIKQLMNNNSVNNVVEELVNYIRNDK